MYSSKAAFLLYHVAGKAHSCLVSGGISFPLKGGDFRRKFAEV